MPSTNNVIKFKQPSTVIKFTEKSVLKIPTSSKRKILIDEQTILNVSLINNSSVESVEWRIQLKD